MELLASVLAAYLIGSVSSAILFSRLLRTVDPRDAGSGNPGATNVLRVSGKLAGVLTLAGDILKGTIPVLAVDFLFKDPAITTSTALAVFLGHLFPAYYQFKGGKGIATMLGIYLAINPLFGCAVAVVWLGAAILTRYSSLSSIISSLVSPALAWYLVQDTWTVVLGAVIFLLVLYRHKDNIKRLIAGQENKINLSSN